MCAAVDVRYLCCLLKGVLQRHSLAFTGQRHTCLIFRELVSAHCTRHLITCAPTELIWFLLSSHTVTCTNVLIFNRSSLHSYSHSFWRCFQLLSLAQAGRLKTLDWKRRHWTAEGHEKCETRKPGTKNPKLHGERRVWTDMLLYLLLLFVFTHKCCTIYIWAEFISQYEYIRPML